MGNNLSAAGQKATSSAGGAIGCGVVIGGAGLGFGSLWLYLSAENYGAPGWVGPAGLFATIGTGIGGVIAVKVARNRAKRRAIERAQQAWNEHIANYPERVHYALTVLADPWSSVLMWTHPRIGIGRAPDQRIAQDMGDGPKLVPGQDPGYEPDWGYRPSPSGVLFRLALPAGVSADAMHRVLPNIASSLHVPKVVLTESDGHVIRLELVVRNPLEATRKFQKPELSPVPLKNLRVGVMNNGDWYRIAIQSNHLFLAGLTGSGKSGVLWSIIGALAPDIWTGRVELYVIDLKMGTEMAAGFRLFAAFAWQVLAALDILEMLVRKMQARGNPRREDAMRTGRPQRDFDPQPGDPQMVLMIDEILDLLKISGDYKLGDRELIQFDGSTQVEKNMTVAKYAGRLLLLLLSQARSFGITVVIATQNAAKEIFELLRDMFPTMIGLRLASDQQVQMVFGSGAAERGIEPTTITPAQAGTVYVDSPEKTGQATRARFFYVSDDDIMHLVEIYGRGIDTPSPIVLASSAPVIDAEPTDETPGEQDQDDDGTVVAFTPLAEQINTKAPRCLYCGAEIELLPGGGRPPKFCRGNNHRQLYHRDKKRMESQKKTS